MHEAHGNEFEGRPLRDKPLSLPPPRRLPDSGEAPVGDPAIGRGKFTSPRDHFSNPDAMG